MHCEAGEETVGVRWKGWATRYEQLNMSKKNPKVCYYTWLRSD